MNYQETLDYLFNQLPVYQNQGITAYKANLNNIIKLCELFNNPQKTFKSIHLAGTNGKGSCSHMLASIFQEAGYKVGLYTSPHLKDFRERIKINGKEISESEVISFVKENKDKYEPITPSFFELTVALAFKYFSEQKVDIAIIETGLGGRLDSTNIINPELSIITNISKDHAQFLGNTLEKIANEKAGIIKPNTPVVIGDIKQELIPIFKNKAEKLNSNYYLSQDKEDIQPSDLIGPYQTNNQKTVIQAINVLKKNWNISEKHIKQGLNKVIPNTGLQGRWQILNTSPLTICDVGHNKAGLEFLVPKLNEIAKNKLIIVFGTVKDKDTKEILGLLPKKAHYIFTQANIARAKNASELFSEAKDFNLNGEIILDVKSALKKAQSLAKEEDTIFIGGSTFVVAEIL